MSQLTHHQAKLLAKKYLQQHPRHRKKILSTVKGISKNDKIFRVAYPIPMRDRTFIEFIALFLVNENRISMDELVLLMPKYMCFLLNYLIKKTFSKNLKGYAFVVEFTEIKEIVENIIKSYTPNT